MKISDLKSYEVQVTPSQIGFDAEAAEAQNNNQDNDGFILDTVQGLAKSGADLIVGAGEIGRGIQKKVSKVADSVLGTEGFGLSNENIFDKGSESNTNLKTKLERDTAGEKLGGFIGDVASFAVPGGAAAKSVKGVGYANFLRRAASLGASDALVTTTRQGEVNKSAVDAAIIGAAFPVVGKVAGKAKNAVIPSGKDAGARVINSLIKPLLKDFSYGKNPGKAVAEAGITANSLDELASNITVALNKEGDNISKLVAKSTKTFDATESLKALDDALFDAQKAPNTNSTIISRLQGLKNDILRAGEDGIPTRKLTDLSANEMWELNKEIGELTRWTGNATDDEIVNKALRRAYGATRSQLDDAVEGLSQTSEKYANLKSAQIATQYRDKIAARQNLVSFSGTQLGTAAAVASAIVSGGAVIPILVGAGAGVTTEALKSPAVKTRVAAWLASSSKEQVKEAFTQAPWLRGAIQTALFNDIEEVESQEQQ